ncbi:MAG: nucleotidyltransferase family protein [Candidatus Sulfotelmatobacter sp.]
MKAMILAAGMGTRPRPLTDNRPKALVTVAGRTLLEITLSRLRTFDVREVIINVHHFADKVVDYLKANDNFGMRVEVSREEVLLDTGGGLKKAAHFFLDDPARLDEPFILHNVDVISTIDLQRMLQFHRERGALATLAVQERETSRYLLFNEQGALRGRGAGRKREAGLGRPAAQVQALAFSGIHVISPRIFSHMTEDGAFSIVDCYLRLAALGEKIVAFSADEYYWRDLGRPENIARVERDFKNKVVS